MQHSNSYIIAFAAGVCFVCGLVVSVAATSLKERQDLNALIDQQKNVLSVAGLIEDGEKVSADRVRQLFDEFIRAKVIDLDSGEVAEGVDPKEFDQAQAAKDPSRSTKAPENAAKVLRIPNQGLVYEVYGKGELESIILPIEGMGLWGVLYGYIALAPDATTIKGITYYKNKETPGLGAEVGNPRWKAKWPGRKAFDERGNVKIAVTKGAAGPPANDPYRVDGLSGATLTSRGVTNMLRFWLGDLGFGPYLASHRSAQGA